MTSKVSSFPYLFLLSTVKDLSKSLICKTNCDRLKILRSFPLNYFLLSLFYEKLPQHLYKLRSSTEKTKLQWILLIFGQVKD